MKNVSREIVSNIKTKETFLISMTPIKFTAKYFFLQEELENLRSFVSVGLIVAWNYNDIHHFPVENQYSITWVQIADKIFRVQTQMEKSSSLQLLSLQDNGSNLLALSLLKILYLRYSENFLLTELELQRRKLVNFTIVSLKILVSRFGKFHNVMNWSWFWINRPNFRSCQTVFNSLVFDSPLDREFFCILQYIVVNMFWVDHFS